MAKWYGVIGYAIPKQVRPGVWQDEIIDREYRGDLIKHSNRWSTNSDSTNDDLVLNNQISIIADAFAEQYCQRIKYVTFMDAKWKITSVDVTYPRLLLTIGGVYNG